MAKETTDCTGYGLFPEGKYTFTVTEVPEKFRAGKSIRFVWKFVTEVLNEAGEWVNRKYVESIMVFEMADLLRALGYEEKGKNKFEWDRDTVVGKRFTAEIQHIPDRKDQSKVWARLRNIKSSESVPF